MAAPTARPGATFYYCRGCGRKMVKTRGRRRFQKRFWLTAAMLLSSLIWFAAINLGRTGHTKIIRSSQILVQHAHATAARARVEARKTLGAPAHEAR